MTSAPRAARRPMLHRRLLLTAMLLLAAAPTAAAQTASAVPVVRAVRAAAAIRLDGRLDDDVWRSAPTVGDFTRVEPEEGVASAFPTTIRLAFDETNVYVAIEARDPGGRDGVRVVDMRRDFAYDRNDYVGIVFDGFLDRRTALVFEVTPLGTQRDLQVIDGTNASEEWDAAWSVRTQVGDDGWTAEVAIPWPSLNYRQDGGPWGINFYRFARRTNESSGWRPWPRALNPFRMDFAGEVTGLEPPPAGAAVRVRPYLLGRRASDAAVAASTADGVLSRNDARVGGEVSWAPDAGTLVEATVRTDFAQADVDRQVVNLSRFSVFFPERRQFFLETAALFTTGLTSSFVVTPFFSRTIGLAADGTAVPIQAGLRATHRGAGWSGGLLAVRQDGRADEGPATFGLGRFSRNIGRNGTVGLLAAVRTAAAGPRGGVGRTEGVGALDWAQRFGPAVQWTGMVSAATAEDGDAMGVAMTTRIRRATSGSVASFTGALVTREYAPVTGFVSRNDVLYLAPEWMRDLRPAWLPASVRSIRPGAQLFAYLGPRDGALQESFTNVYTDVIFRSGAQITPFVERWTQALAGEFAPVSDVRIAAGDYRYTRGGVYLQSDLSRPVGGAVTLIHGGFFGGRRTQLRTSLRAAPSPYASLALDYELNVLRGVGQGARDVTTHLVGPELRVAVGPRLQASGFWQYNSDQRRASLNARLTWEFAPLSRLFVVWNDRRATGTFDPSRPADPRSRELLVKLSYLWQL